MYELRLIGYLQIPLPWPLNKRMKITLPGVPVEDADGPDLQRLMDKYGVLGRDLRMVCVKKGGG